MTMSNYSVEDKWDFDFRKNGFSVLPNQVFYINQFLSASQKLSATELLLILNLLTWWWKKDSLPFPSKNLLAERLGLSARQVQRAIKTLEEKQMLRSIPRFENGRQKTNQYDLSLFVELVKQYVVARNASNHSTETHYSENIAA